MVYHSRVGHFPDSRIMTGLVPSSHDGLGSGEKREKRGGGKGEKRRKGKGGKRSGETREEKKTRIIPPSKPAADARLGRVLCGWGSSKENQWSLSDHMGFRLNPFPVISCPLFLPQDVLVLRMFTLAH